MMSSSTTRKARMREVERGHQAPHSSKAVNTDARKIITRGEPANFFVYYLVHDETSKHNLTLDGYGADDRWVLLEPIA